MMFDFFVVSYLCGKVMVIDLSNELWNSRDEENLAIAKARCVVIYPDAPCLKVFIKKSELNYNAICK